MEKKGNNNWNGFVFIARKRNKYCKIWSKKKFHLQQILRSLTSWSPKFQRNKWSFIRQVYSLILINEDGFMISHLKIIDFLILNRYITGKRLDWKVRIIKIHLGTRNISRQKDTRVHTVTIRWNKGRKENSCQWSNWIRG